LVWEEGKLWSIYSFRKKPRTVDAVVGAAFLLTPLALKKVGLFDERFFMYFEDLDYCRRVKKAGLKVYYLPSQKWFIFMVRAVGNWLKIKNSGRD